MKQLIRRASASAGLALMIALAPATPAGGPQLAAVAVWSCRQPN